MGDGAFAHISAMIAADTGFWVRWITRMGVPDADAEDVLQEALLSAWRNQHTCRAGSETVIRSWFMTILSRQATNYLRQSSWRRRWIPLELAPPAAVSIDPDLTVGTQITEARRGIREAHWRCMLLRAAGYNLAESACILGVPEGTAKSWLSRGIARGRRVTGVIQPRQPAQVQAVSA